ncbi:MAG: 4'-phosphopantetheinyl transferase superfamily protein [Christensenellaceae bacterium]|nr:4'-phosphopantetheinyl transferase superfamily protein [Christensenellaceae bacterium]
MVMNESNVTRVFVLDYGKGFNIEEFFPFFSEERMRKIENCRHSDMRVQLAAAEITVCAAMKSIGRDYAPPRYNYAACGMPCMEGGYISITHTHGIAACAVSHQRVGIDVERIRPVNHLLAARILCDEELAEFRKLIELRKPIAPDKEEKLCGSMDADDYILQAWTAKESVLKLTGAGLGGGMKSFLYDKNRNYIRANANGVQYPVDMLKLVVSECRRGNEVLDSRNALLAVCTETQTELKVFMTDSPSECFEGNMIPMTMSRFDM